MQVAAPTHGPGAARSPSPGPGTVSSPKPLAWSLFLLLWRWRKGGPRCEDSPLLSCCHKSLCQAPSPVCPPCGDALFPPSRLRWGFPRGHSQGLASSHCRCVDPRTHPARQPHCSLRAPPFCATYKETGFSCSLCAANVEHLRGGKMEEKRVSWETGHQLQVPVATQPPGNRGTSAHMGGGGGRNAGRPSWKGP